jgi:hypothetical protein
MATQREYELLHPFANIHTSYNIMLLPVRLSQEFKSKMSVWSGNPLVSASNKSALLDGIYFKDSGTLVFSQYMDVTPTWYRWLQIDLGKSMQMAEVVISLFSVPCCGTEAFEVRVGNVDVSASPPPSGTLITANTVCHRVRLCIIEHFSAKANSFCSSRRTLCLLLYRTKRASTLPGVCRPRPGEGT